MKEIAKDHPKHINDKHEAVTDVKPDNLTK